MEKFEYKTIVFESMIYKKLSSKIDDNEFQYQLDELGKQGWELVSAIPFSGLTQGSTTSIVTIFKRKI